MRFLPVAFQLRLGELLLAFAILAAFPSLARCAVFEVRDFGARGDGKSDDGPAAQRAVEAAIRSGAPGEVHFPVGRWLLKEASAANFNHVRIDGAHGLSIVGEAGAVLVSDSPKSNFFRITRSVNVVVRSLTLERNAVVFSQGVVESIDAAKRSVRFRVARGYAALDSPLIALANYLIGFPHPETGSWGDHDSACGWYEPGNPTVCWPPKITQRRLLADGSWELSLNTVPPPSDLGKPAVVWGWDAGLKGHAFFVSGTDTLLIEDVAYYAGGAEGGFVLNAGNSGDFTFRRFTVDVRPNSGDYIAASSGSMVFNNHIHLTLDDVTIQRVWDDAVNMGANFARIYAQDGPRSLLVDGSRGDFRVGDTLAMWDWPSKQDRVHVTLTGVHCIHDERRSCWLTLDRNVVVAHAGYAPTKATHNDSDGIDRVISLQSAGSLHIANSQFQALHARDVLVKASNSVIENTLFHDTAMAGILVGPDYFWDEGPNVCNLAIEHNVFKNVGGSKIGVSAEPSWTGNISVVSNQMIDPGQYRHGIMGDPNKPVLVEDSSAHLTKNSVSIKP
jgi:hypothetical protein